MNDLKIKVIELLKQNLTYKEIAERLNITPRGVFNIEVDYRRELAIQKCLAQLNQN